MPPLAPPDPATFDDLTERERSALAQLERDAEWESGYSQQHATRPQTIGYSLVDSPVGLCAWVVEKFSAWTDGDGLPEQAVPRDRILDKLMLYWLPRTLSRPAVLGEHARRQPVDLRVGHRRHHRAHRWIRLPARAAATVPALGRATVYRHPPLERARSRRPLPGARGARPVPVPARLYVPHAPAPRGALVWLHPGGFVAGEIDDVDAVCRKLSDRTGLVVLSAAYRLAPEHPYLAALEDVGTASRWLYEHPSPFGVDRARIAIGGQSAGATLAAAHVLRMRDEGGPVPAMQVLAYPVLDPALSARSYAENATGMLLTSERPGWYWDRYLGERPRRRLRPPRRCPLRRPASDPDRGCSTWSFTSSPSHSRAAPAPVTLASHPAASMTSCTASDQRASRSRCTV